MNAPWRVRPSDPQVIWPPLRRRERLKELPMQTDQPPTLRVTIKKNKRGTWTWEVRDKFDTFEDGPSWRRPSPWAVRGRAKSYAEANDRATLCVHDAMGRVLEPREADYVNEVAL